MHSCIKTRLAALTLSIMLPGAVSAASFDSLENLSQEQFLKISENIAAAVHYKGVCLLYTSPSPRDRG